MLSKTLSVFSPHHKTRKKCFFLFFATVTLFTRSLSRISSVESRVIVFFACCRCASTFFLSSYPHTNAFIHLNTMSLTVLWINTSWAGLAHKKWTHVRIVLTIHGEKCAWEFLVLLYTHRMNESPRCENSARMKQHKKNNKRMTGTETHACLSSFYLGFWILTCVRFFIGRLWVTMNVAVDSHISMQELEQQKKHANYWVRVPVVPFLSLCMYESLILWHHSISPCVPNIIVNKIW